MMDDLLETIHSQSLISFFNSFTELEGFGTFFLEKIEMRLRKDCGRQTTGVVVTCFFSKSCQSRHRALSLST